MIPQAVRIFVSTEPQDMRRGFDRLANVVREELGGDPPGPSSPSRAPFAAPRAPAAAVRAPAAAPRARTARLAAATPPSEGSGGSARFTGPQQRGNACHAQPTQVAVSWQGGCRAEPTGDGEHVNFSFDLTGGTDPEAFLVTVTITAATFDVTAWDESEES